MTIYLMTDNTNVSRNTQKNHIIAVRKYHLENRTEQKT